MSSRVEPASLSHHGLLRGAIIGFALCGCIGGCDRFDVGPRGATSRDSAGIIIVENPDPLTADSTAWAIDTTPRPRIGETDGPRSVLFGRITGVTRLSDGRIAVGDAVSTDVRFFDSTGAYVERIGGVGQGPGEFENFSLVHRGVGDSLIVTDHEGGRYHILDPGGEYHRPFRLVIKDDVVRQRYTSPRTHAVFGDGSLLATDFIKCPGSREPGICTDSGRFMRVRTDGERLALFGTHVYAREEMVVTSQGRTRPVREWQPTAYWTARGSRFYYADAATFEIRIYGGSGRLERIVRAAHAPQKVPVPPPRFSRFPIGDVSPARRASLEEFFAAREAATIPERLPAFDGLNVDRVGNIWVREFVPFWVTTPRRTARWWVFDSTGVLRHTVFMPYLHQTIPWLGGSYIGPEIGDDYILGIRSDRDGVQEVVMFTLRKNATP
jgi:hypothetical protein